MLNKHIWSTLNIKGGVYFAIKTIIFFTLCSLLKTKADLELFSVITTA